jgi:hypothetical protein
MTGGFLGGHGLSLPVFWPERALLIRVTENSTFGGERSGATQA